MKTVKHKHAWTYFGGMATCVCGLELLPDNKTRRPAHSKWLAHRKAGKLPTKAVT